MIQPFNITLLTQNESLIVDPSEPYFTDYNCSSQSDGMLDCSRKPLIVKIEPGYYSDPNYLNLTSYKVLSFDSRKMEIQLDIQLPQYVSANKQFRENLTVIFSNLTFF